MKRGSEEDVEILGFKPTRMVEVILPGLVRDGAPLHQQLVLACAPPMEGWHAVDALVRGVKFAGTLRRGAEDFVDVTGQTTVRASDPHGVLFEVPDDELLRWFRPSMNLGLAWPLSFEFPYERGLCLSLRCMLRYEPRTEAHDGPKS